MSALPRIAAIVLNYNGRELALLSLGSLARIPHPGLTLVHVDNGSTDGSTAAVVAAFPQVHQIRTEPNLGISGGLNLGIRWALAAGFDWLMLLNNDIEADPQLVAELLAVAERDPRIGCVGPKTFYYADRARLWSAGGRLRFREAVTSERGMGELDRGRWDRDEEVAYVNGCCMLIRREAMVATGLWDPVYHVGVEDADWCVRMRRAGFTCWYAHRARLWHMVSPSVGGYTPGRTFRTARSTAIFVRKYANPLQWASFLAWSAVALPAAYLRELPRHNTAAVTAKLRGLLAGLREPLPPLPELTAAEKRGPAAA